MSRKIKGLLAATAGVVTFLVLFPFAGLDDFPTKHFSVFGNRVPTGNPLAAIGAGVFVGILVWFVSSRWDERRRHR